MKQRHRIVVSFSRLFTVLVAVSAVGAVGAAHLRHSAAASSGNPYGYLDYCTHSGVTTYIYGWAADPQVTTASVNPNVVVRAGVNSAQVSTNLATYRTSVITNYIHQHYPGDPTPGEYGFVAAFNDLYKGTSYTVSGTIINIGIGSNTAAGVNGANTLDGSPVSGFAGYKLPDACLTTPTTAPPPPATTPAPASMPAPAPTPTIKHSNVSSNKTSTLQSTPAATPTAPTSVNKTNAQVAAGTTSAKLTVPTSNVATLSITYQAAGGHSMTSPDQPVTTNPTSVVLSNLQAKTTYTYQINRINSAGSTATSPTATFKTNGYTIGINFTDAAGKPVSGIPGSIDGNPKTQVKSDSEGSLTFHDSSDGTHTVSYVYHGMKFSEEFDTSAATPPSDPTKVTTLIDTVNVSTLTATSGKQPGSGLWRLIIALIIVLLVITFGAWIFIRRRRLKLQHASLNTPISSGNRDLLGRAAVGSHAPNHPPAQEPLPAHAGQSLRDMVVESIRKQGLPINGPIPTVPGHPGTASSMPAPDAQSALLNTDAVDRQPALNPIHPLDTPIPPAAPQPTTIRVGQNHPSPLDESTRSSHGDNALHIKH